MVRLNRVNCFWKIIVGSKWNVSQVEFVLVAAFCVENNLKRVTRFRKEKRYLKSVLFVQFSLIATLTLSNKRNLNFYQSLFEVSTQVGV